MNYTMSNEQIKQQLMYIGEELGSMAGALRTGAITVNEAVNEFMELSFTIKMLGRALAEREAA